MWVLGLGQRSVLCAGTLQEEHVRSGRGLVDHGFEVRSVFLKFTNFSVPQVPRLKMEG